MKYENMNEEQKKEVAYLIGKLFIAYVQKTKTIEGISHRRSRLTDLFIGICDTEESKEIIKQLKKLFCSCDKCNLGLYDECLCGGTIE